jgi:lipopolysaccharide export system protein LptC
MKVVERQAEFAPDAVLRQSGLTRAVRSPLGIDYYSCGVGLLKRLLPAVGAGLLLLVAMWPRLSPLIESVRLSVAGIDLREARELKMTRPRYAGTDRLNRPYVVTAAAGRQLPSRSDLMSLEDPKAVLIAHSGAKVVLTATTGIYQSQSQLLDLFDNVVLTHQNGTRFVTQRAHANLANDTGEGHDPIEGHGPSGDVWGRGFRVLDRGDTIVFTGRSRAILKGSKPTKPTAPAEPPAGILKTAAAVEAAAAAPSDPRTPAAMGVTKSNQINPPDEPRLAPGQHPVVPNADKTRTQIEPFAAKADRHAD